MDNFLGYVNCLVERNGQWLPIVFNGGKRHSKGLVSRIDGVTTPEQAQLYRQCKIAISIEQLPELEGDDYYWRQLEGLQVVTSSSSGEDQLLGKVHHMMDTGANDVIVVHPCSGSIDKRERLIPYLPESVVKEVDIEGGVIRVDWDPEF